MGITLNKKTAPEAPKQEEAPAPAAAAPKAGGIKIGNSKAKPAPVSAEKVEATAASLAAKGTATLTTDNKSGKKATGSTLAQEQVDVPTSVSTATAADNPDALCRVGVQAQYTHNLGDYNSTKVGVSLSVPCKHDELNAVFEFTETWVNDRMQATVDALKGDA